MKHQIFLIFRILVHAAESDFQLYFPPDRAEAFDGARSSLRIENGDRFATCFWFKSIDSSGGEIIRFSDSSNNIILTTSIKENKIIISSPDDQSELPFSNGDLRDYRWHQICVDCSTTFCQPFLDGFKSAPIQIAFPSLIGQQLLINLGYGAEFKGKVQKLEIGSGPGEVEGTESRTFCGVEYRTISDAFRKYKIGGEDFLITRPIHTRDYESVCNDLLSVDCGLDSISISVSHPHLASVGNTENDIGKFPPSRLSLMKPCGNFTLKGFTTFTISPPDACGSEYITSQYDRTIRNSVLTYANDGQVFTADFQCKYPIDVTAVEYVQPIKSQNVKFRQKVLEVGLTRFDGNDFQKISENGYDVELGDVLHMAAVTPDEIDRDVRILIKSCSSNGIQLITDFGCSKSDAGYVYSNGDASSSRFSIRIPDWVMDFRCQVALCDWGDDCTIKCGKRGPRLRRDVELEDAVGTTESPFIPIATTPGTIAEEIWTDQKASLEDLSETTVVFGPLNWLTVTRPDTTMLPVVDTTMEDSVYSTIEDDRIYTTKITIMDIGNKSDRDQVAIDQKVTTAKPDDVTDDEFLFGDEDDEMKEDIIIVTEEDMDDSTMPGWIGIVLIGTFVFTFIAGITVFTLRWHRSKSESKLLSGSY